MATRRLFNRRKLCIAITHLHRDLMNSPFYLEEVRMYADTTVNNLQATLPLISQLSGQQQEVAQKLKDAWRFFVAQTEKSDPKKVFEDAQYLHLRKPAYLQESGDGERLYQSLMALSADRLMEQQATNIQVRAILADHVPLLE